MLQIVRYRTFPNICPNMIFLSIAPEGGGLLGQYPPTLYPFLRKRMLNFCLKGAEEESISQHFPPFPAMADIKLFLKRYKEKNNSIFVLD